MTTNGECVDDCYMTLRILSLTFDRDVSRNFDLIRALYDKDQIDISPPFIELISSFDESIGTTDLVELVGLIASAHQPFLVELANVCRHYDGNEQLLQLVVVQGSEECQKLAKGLYRDIFPHWQDSKNPPPLLNRLALPIGRFQREDQAESAVTELRGREYFAVMSQVSILESDAKSGGWRIISTLPLGKYSL